MAARKKLRRREIRRFFANLEPCLVGMGACSSAHFTARQLEALGHTVKLMAPQFVKPYVKTNKHDAADADVICGAVKRPSMRFVAKKTAEHGQFCRCAAPGEDLLKPEQPRAPRSVVCYLNLVL